MKQQCPCGHKWNDKTGELIRCPKCKRQVAHKYWCAFVSTASMAGACDCGLTPRVEDESKNDN